MQQGETIDMSCRAILHETRKESIPLLLVRSGKLTPRQCDHEFKGKTGECPTCQAMIERTDFDGGGSYAAAMQLLKGRGQSVTYKAFGYGNTSGVEPWRVCYWGHPPGYWEGVQFRDCQNPATNAHSVHLKVIKEYYAEQFKPEDGFVIKEEERLRKPGDPPRPYSPDLAIYGPKGERMVAVEYQRSYESYDKFADRDELRRLEKWAAVDWWFDDTQKSEEKENATVYSKSQMHRTHLAAMPVHFYRCWVDLQTLKLQAEYGKCGDLPPDRRKRVDKRIERSDLTECSTANVIKLLEDGPERTIIKEYIEPIKAQKNSKLEFLQNVEYSLERERRLAIAVKARNKRLEEQDRRHREWVAEQRRKEEEQRLQKELEKAKLEARRAVERIQSHSEYERKEEDRRKDAEQAKRQRMIEEQIARWQIPFEKVDVPVTWMRGKPFNGVITRWRDGRPVVTDTATGKTRWAYSKSDYVLRQR